MSEEPRPLGEVIGAAGLAWDEALALAQRGLRLFCLAADLPPERVGWNTPTHIVHALAMATPYVMPRFDFAWITELSPRCDWRQCRDGGSVGAIRFEAVLPRTFKLEVLEWVEWPDGTTFPANRGETIDVVGPLRGFAKDGVAMTRASLWVMPSELAMRARRPRLLSDVAAGSSLGDVLQQIVGGTSRVACTLERLRSTGGRLTWEWDGADGGASLGLVGPPNRPPPVPVEYVYLDEPGPGLLDLVRAGGTVTCAWFEAAGIDLTARPDLTRVSVGVAEPVRLELADLWVLPDDLATFRLERNPLGNDLGETASRPERKGATAAEQWKEAAFDRADALWRSDFDKWSTPNGKVATERLALALRDGDDGGAPITHVAQGTLVNALSERRDRFTRRPGTTAS